MHAFNACRAAGAASERRLRRREQRGPPMAGRALLARGRRPSRSHHKMNPSPRSGRGSEVPKGPSVAGNRGLLRRPRSEGITKLNPSPRSGRGSEACYAGRVLQSIQTEAEGRGPMILRPSEARFLRATEGRESNDPATFRWLDPTTSDRRSRVNRVSTKC